jgi:hypothetical protein
MGRKKKKRSAKRGPEASSTAQKGASPAIAPIVLPPFLKRNIDLFGAAGIALFFVSHLFISDDYFLGSGTDIISLQYPAHAYAMHWMRQGILPFWNPFIFCGVPFQAGFHGFLYPGLWTGLLFPPGLDIKIGIALHLILAAVGAAWFSRGHVRSPISRILCGEIFALSGFMTLHLFAGHRIMVMTASYLPLAAGMLRRIVRGERRFILSGCLVWGMMILARHYQVVYIGSLGIGIWLVLEMALEERGDQLKSKRQRLLAVTTGAGVVLAGLAIAAVQLIPTLTNVALFQRPESDAAFAASFSSAPINLLSYLFPHFFGNRVDAPFIGDWSYWESLGYIGIIPLMLIAAAPGLLTWRRIAPEMAVIAIALLLALGAHTPVFDLYLRLVPGSDMFRSPGRFAILVALFGGLLAARMADGVIYGELKQKSKSRFITSIALPLGAGVAIALWFYSWQASDFSRWWESFGNAKGIAEKSVSALLDLVKSDLNSALITLPILAGCFVVARRRPNLSGAIGVVLMVITAIDLYHFGHRFLKTGDASRFHLPEAFERAIAREDEPALRIVPPAASRFVNFPMMSSVGNPGGYDVFMTKRYAEYLNVSQGRDMDRFIAYERLRRGGPLLRHLGPCYLFTTMEMRNGRNRYFSGYTWMVPAGRVAGYYRYEDPYPVPRAFLVHRVSVISDGRERVRTLAKRDFNIREEVILDAAHPEFKPEGLDAPMSERVRITALKPNRVELAISAKARGVLVMSDVLMPGWEAWVDGRPVPLVHANHVMRALPVTAGEHRVVMSYLPTGFALGAAISSIALFLLLAGFVLQKKGRLLMAKRT